MPTLEALGQALYGPRWQSELARALGVADRTVRRWAVSGETPDAHQEAIRVLLQERIRLLKSLL